MAHPFAPAPSHQVRAAAARRPSLTRHLVRACATAGRWLGVRGGGAFFARGRAAAPRGVLVCEPLEPRLLLSADPLTYVVQAGTAANLELCVVADDQGVKQLKILDRSAATPVVVAQKALAEVGSVQIQGADLDDALRIDASVVGLAPSLTVAFDGGGGHDRLQGPDRGATFTLTGPGTGQVGAVVFSGVETLVGGSGPDELRGWGQDLTWNLTGSGAGEVGGTAFAGMERLQGAADNQDTFVVGQDGALAAGLDGGAGGFDTLEIQGSYSAAVYTADGPQSGTVILDGQTLAYGGLEPVLYDTPVADLTLDLSGGHADLAALHDLGGGFLSLSTTTFTAEWVTFAAPTHSLTINLGAGSDILTVFDLGSSLNNVSLSILGQDGTDKVQFIGDLALGTGDLSADAERIEVADGIILTADDVALTAKASGPREFDALALGNQVLDGLGIRSLTDLLGYDPSSIDPWTLLNALDLPSYLGTEAQVQVLGDITAAGNLSLSATADGTKVGLAIPLGSDKATLDLSWDQAFVTVTGSTLNAGGTLSLAAKNAGTRTIGADDKDVAVNIVFERTGVSVTDSILGGNTVNLQAEGAANWSASAGKVIQLVDGAVTAATTGSTVTAGSGGTTIQAKESGVVTSASSGTGGFAGALAYVDKDTDAKVDGGSVLTGGSGGAIQVLADGQGKVETSAVVKPDDGKSDAETKTPKDAYVFAINVAQGDVRAQVLDSTIDTATTGGAAVTLQATSQGEVKATIDAGAGAAGTAEDRTGVGLVVAVNFVGYDINDALQNAIDDLLGDPNLLGNEDPSGTRAWVEDSAILSGAGVSVSATGSATVAADLSNKVEVSGGGGAQARQSAVGFTLALNHLVNPTEAAIVHNDGPLPTRIDATDGIAVQATNATKVSAKLSVAATATGTGGGTKASAIGGLVALNTLRGDALATVTGASLAAGGGNIQIGADLAANLTTELKTESKVTSGTKTNAGSSLAVGGAVAANALLGTAQALVTDSQLMTSSTTVDANHGNVTVTATNDSRIQAKLDAKLTSDGAAIGVALAFNTLGIDWAGFLFETPETLSGTDLVHADTAAAVALVRGGSTIDAAGALRIEAKMQASVDSKVVNSARVIAASFDTAETAINVGVVFALNRMSTSTEAAIEDAGAIVVHHGDLQVLAQDADTLTAEVEATSLAIGAAVDSAKAINVSLSGAYNLGEARTQAYIQGTGTSASPISVTGGKVLVQALTHGTIDAKSKASAVAVSASLFSTLPVAGGGAAGLNALLGGTSAWIEDSELTVVAAAAVGGAVQVKARDARTVKGSVEASATSVAVSLTETAPAFAIGLAYAENFIGYGIDFTRNPVAVLARITHSGIVAQGDVTLTAEADGVVEAAVHATAVGIGLSTGSGFALSGSGLAAFNRVGMDVAATLDGARVSATGHALVVSASDTAKIASDTGAVAVTGALTGGSAVTISIGVSYGDNLVDNRVTAALINLASGALDLGSIAVQAEDSSTIEVEATALGLAAGVAFGSAGVAVGGGGAIAQNRILGATAAVVSDSDIDGVGNLDLTATGAARISATIRAVAATVAYGDTAGVGVALGVAYARNEIGYDLAAGTGYDLQSSELPTTLTTGQRVRIAEGPLKGEVYRYLGPSVSQPGGIALTLQDYADAGTWERLDLVGNARRVAAYVADSDLDLSGVLSLLAQDSSTIDATVLAGSVALAGGGTAGVAVGAAGAVAQNRIATSTQAYIQGGAGSGIAADSVSITADQTSTIHATTASAALAGSFAGTAGVTISIGLAIADNSIDVFTGAAVRGAGVTTRTGNLNIAATSHLDLAGASVAASLAAAFSGTFGGSVAGGGALSSNRIGVSTQAVGDSSTLTVAGTLGLAAADDSTIQARVFAVAAGIGGGTVGLGVGFGFGRAENLIGDSDLAGAAGVLALLYHSTCVVGGAQLSAVAQRDIGAQVDAAAVALTGGQVGVSLAGGAAITANTIGGTVAVIVDGGTLTSSQGVEVAAADRSEITAVTAAAAISAAFGEVGVALAVGVATATNTVGTQVQAQVSGATVAAAGDVWIHADQDNRIAATAVGVSVAAGFGAVGVGLAGAGASASNSIGVAVLAGIAESMVQAGTDGSGALTVQADNASEIGATIVAVAAGIGGGSVGVGAALGFSEATNSIQGLAGADHPGVDAHIRRAAASAANNVSVRSDADLTIDAIVVAASVAAGGGSLGAAASGAGSTVENRVAVPVVAAIEDLSRPGDRVQAGGTVTVSAGVSTVSEARSGALSLSGAFGVYSGAIAVGVALADNQVGNSVDAHVTNGAVTAGALSVQASADDTLVATAETASLGVSIGIGFALSGGGADAQAAATTSTLSKVQGATVTLTGALEVQSDNATSIRAETSALVGSVGLVAISAAGATAGASVATASEAVLRNSVVNAGSVTIAATATPESAANASGVSIAAGFGLAMGGSRATASATPVVLAHVEGASTNLHVGSLTVTAEVRTPGAGHTAAAVATGAAGGLLLGGVATDARATSAAQASAYITGGGTLSVTGATQIRAGAATDQYAVGNAVGLGLLAVGASFATATSATQTHAYLDADQGLNGGSLAIGASSTDTNLATTVAGAGGIIAGAAATPRTGDTSVTIAEVGDRAHVTLTGGFSVAADHRSLADARLLSVAIGFLSGAGVQASNAFNSTVLARVGVDAVVAAGSVTMTAANRVHKGLGGTAVDGATGGLISGAKARSQTDITLSTRVLVDDRASLTVAGPYSQDHLFALSAYNRIEVQDKVNYKTAGALSGAVADSQVRTLSELAQVWIGVDAQLRSRGAMDLSARSEADVTAKVNVDTYGAGTVSGGEARIDLHPVNDVRIRSGASLVADGDLGLSAGTDTNFGYDVYHLEARLDGFAGSLIPIDLTDAVAMLLQTNQIGVDTGALLQTGGQANLHTQDLAGFTDVHAESDVVSWVSEAADFLGSIFGGSGGAEQYKGTSHTEADAMVRMDGTVETGIHRNVHLNLDVPSNPDWYLSADPADMVAADASPGISYTTGFKSLSSELVTDLDFAKEQLAAYGDANAELKAYYESEVTRLQAELQAQRLAASTSIHIAGHGFATGDAVVYHNLGTGLALGGLVEGQTYYLVRVDADNLSLAKTRADAGLAAPVTIALFQDYASEAQQGAGGTNSLPGSSTLHSLVRGGTTRQFQLVDLATPIPMKQTVPLVRVNPIHAEAGLIDVRGDVLYGTGRWIAPSDATVTIENNSVVFLEILGIDIPENNGGLYFNGLLATTVGTITGINAVNLASDTHLSAGAVAFSAALPDPTDPATRIEVHNTLDITGLTGGDFSWPGLTVLGPNDGGTGISNPRGDVDLATKTATNPNSRGSIEIKGPITAKNINVVAGGDVLIQGITQYAVGGSPYAQWGDVTNGTYAGSSNTADGVREATPAEVAAMLAMQPTATQTLTGDHIVVRAEYIDVNGIIQSGKADLDLTIGTAATAEIQGILSANLPGNRFLLHSVSNSDFAVYYNKAENRIEVSEVRVTGGDVTLEGHVLNTGNGEIRVLGGYGKIAIDNQTSYDIALQRVDASHKGAGVLTIADKTKPQADGSATVSFYSAATRGLGDQPDYETASGWRYGWSVGVDFRTVSRSHKESSSWLGIIGLGSSFDGPWDTVTPIGVPKLVGAGPYYYHDTSASANLAYTFGSQTFTIDSQPTREVNHGSDTTWYGKTTYWADYEKVKGEETVFTHTLSASRNIGVTFTGYESGNVTVTSEAGGDIVLLGSIANPSGATELKTNGSIMSGGAGATVGGVRIDLAAGTGIGSAATPLGTLLAGDLDHRSLTAVTTAGGVALNEAGGDLAVALVQSLDGADISLSAAAGIVNARAGAGWSPGLVKGGAITLEARLGAIGRSSDQPLHLDSNAFLPAGTVGTRTVQVVATGDVYLAETAGDLRLDSLETSGSLWLAVNSGSLIDANNVSQRDERTYQELLTGVWTDLQLTAGTGANDKIQATKDSFAAGKAAEYAAYWQYRSTQADPSVYDSGFQVTLSAEEDAYYRAYYTAQGLPAAAVDAAVATLAASRTQQYHGLHQQWTAYVAARPETAPAMAAYAPDFVYVLTAAEDARITGSIKVWTEDELLNTFGLGLLKPITDTQLDIEEPNIKAAAVTLVVSGDLGRNSGETLIDLSAGTGVTDPDQRVILAAAERTDVTYLSTGDISATVNFADHQGAADPRDTIRRIDGGNWIADGLTAGMSIEVLGSTVNATAMGATYRIAALTADTLRLDSGNALSTDYAIAVRVAGVIDDPTAPVITADSGDLAADFHDNGVDPDTIVRTDGGSWVADGFAAGMRILVAGAGANVTGENAYLAVRSVSAATLVLASYESLADETGAAVRIRGGIRPQVAAIRVSQVDDLNLDATGAIGGSVGGQAYLGSAQDLRLGQLVVGEEARIRTKAAISNQSADGVVNVTALSLILEAAGGNAGTADKPLTIDLDDSAAAALLTARARDVIAVTEAAGDLRLATIFAKNGGVRLEARSGSIVDGLNRTFTNIQAASIDLFAGLAPGATGGIGAADNALDLDAVGAGLLNAWAQGSIHLIDTDGNANLGALVSYTGDLSLVAPLSILDGADLLDPYQPGSPLDPTVPGSRPRVDVVANSVHLVAGLGTIGTSGNELDIDSAYSVAGALTAASLGNTYLNETLGTLSVNTVNTGADATAYIAALSGSILNARTDGGPNVTSGKVWFFAAQDVGAFNRRLSTVTGTVEGQATRGSVYIYNAGRVQIGGVTGGAQGMDAGGAVYFVASSPVTFLNSVHAVDDIVYVAADDANDTDVEHLTADTEDDPDDILVKAVDLAGQALVLNSSGGRVQLLAGDDLILEEGSTVQAATEVDLVGDYQTGADGVYPDGGYWPGPSDQDPGRGALIDLRGTVLAPKVFVFGGKDTDTVVIPHTATGSWTTVRTHGALDPRNGDLVNVGSQATPTSDTGGVLNAIRGTLSIDLGIDRQGVLNLDDSGETNGSGRHGLLTANLLRGLGMGADEGDTTGGAMILYSNVGRLRLTLGDAGGGLTVAGTSAVETRLLGGAGVDAIQVLSTGGYTYLDTFGGDDLVSFATTGQRADVFTGEGADSLILNLVAATLQADTGAGDDTVSGSATVGTLTLAVGDGANAVDLRTTSAAAILTGGSGAERFDLNVVNGTLELDAGGGDDRVGLTLTGATVTVAAGEGADSLTGTASDSRLILDGGGGSDAFVLRAVSGVTEVRGGAGDDRVALTTQLHGVANIDGGDGNDTLDLVATDGTTTVHGGAGDDLLLAAQTAGTTTLSGDAGDDRFRFGRTSGATQVSDRLKGQLIVDGGDGQDALVWDDSGYTGARTVTLGADRVTGLAASLLTYRDLAVFDLRLGRGADTLTVNATHAGQTLLDTGAGNDRVTVNGTGGLVGLGTGAGNDTVTVAASAGALAVDTGAGNDTVILSGSGTATGLAALRGRLTLEGGTGTDKLQVLNSRTGTLTRGTNALLGLGLGLGVGWRGFETYDLQAGTVNTAAPGTALYFDPATGTLVAQPPAVGLDGWDFDHGAAPLPTPGLIAWAQAHPVS